MSRRIENKSFNARAANEHQLGFSLVEMMIAMTIGIILMASILTAFSGSVKSSTDTTNRVRLAQELDSVIDLIAAELRRAGYNKTSSEITYLATSNTAFGVSVPTGQTPALSCVLFSYDSNANKILDNNEKLGFRLNNNAVQYSENVTNCAGSWQPVTDSNVVKVTGLEFKLTTRCSNLSADPITEAVNTCPAATAGQILSSVKTVEIKLKGHLVNDAGSERELVSTVRLRNEAWQVM